MSIRSRAQSLEVTSHDAVVFPLVFRSSTQPDGILPNAVATAFDKALDDLEQPAPAFFDIEGMSGRRYRLFINALMGLIPNPRYLEVGVWAGSTLCSAIAGNKVQAVAIDNWSQFAGPRERFLENLKQFGALKAIGVTNIRLIGMILLQAFTAGALGFALGTGLAASFFEVTLNLLQTRHIILMWQCVALTGGCIFLVVVLASVLSIRRVLVLEPAAVFRG